MAVDPQHMYSNEAERADSDFYDYFKLEKNVGLHGFYNTISALYGLSLLALSEMQ